MGICSPLACRSFIQEGEEAFAVLPLKLGILPVLMGVVAIKYWQVVAAGTSDCRFSEARVVRAGVLLLWTVSHV